MMDGVQAGESWCAFFGWCSVLLRIFYASLFVFLLCFFAFAFAFAFCFLRRYPLYLLFFCFPVSPFLFHIVHEGSVLCLFVFFLSFILYICSSKKTKKGDGAFFLFIYEYEI